MCLTSIVEDEADNTFSVVCTAMYFAISAQRHLLRGRDSGLDFRDAVHQCSHPASFGSRKRHAIPSAGPQIALGSHRDGSWRQSRKVRGGVRRKSDGPVESSHVRTPSAIPGGPEQMLRKERIRQRYVEQTEVRSHDVVLCALVQRQK